MNTLYFIGNGFDINLGMKTRYTDFYKYYKTIESKSDVINKLKESISTDIENWSDLELALGKYTKNIESTSEFDEIYEDLEDNLADYIQKQEDNYDFDKIDNKDFFVDLMNPENQLPRVSKIAISNNKNRKFGNANEINLITFNYTMSVERILGETDSNINLIDENGNKIKFVGVDHIHGFTNKRMVMGVNDLSQITNTQFHSNQDILETLVKKDCNKVLKHNLENKCKHLISKADLICIFGCSIGDTDKLWWELIGEKLKEQALIIIFEKGVNIPARRMHLAGRKERKVQEYFLSKTKLTNEEKKNVINNIFIAHNSGMFDLVKK